MGEAHQGQSFSLCALRLCERHSFISPASLENAEAQSFDSDEGFLKNEQIYIVGRSPPNPDLYLCELCVSARDIVFF